MDKTSTRTFWEQIRRNSVALISLVIALSSLSYNTWRNEQSEDNRNQRQASFVLLMNLNQLQQVVFSLHYDKDKAQTPMNNPRFAWVYALAVRDMSRLLHAPLPSTAEKLLTTWRDNWEDVDQSKKSLDLILEQIDNVRNKTLTLLQALD